MTSYVLFEHNFVQLFPSIMLRHKNGLRSFPWRWVTGFGKLKEDFPTFFAKFCNEEKPLNLGSTTYCLIAIQTTKINDHN